MGSASAGRTPRPTSSRGSLPKDETTEYGKLDGFHAEVPKQDSGRFCERERRLLIIRGEVVVPRAEELVVRYKL